MKYLTTLFLTILFLAILFLSSCTKKDEPATEASKEVTALLAIRSIGAIPSNAKAIRLTELLHNSYSEIQLDSKKATDTIELSVPFHSIPEGFDAIVSVYYKDGTSRNTTLRNVQLSKGKKNTYISNFFAGSLQITYDDEWLEPNTIDFEF